MKTEHLTLSSSEKISFVSNFSTMLSAGISILEAVDSLLEDSKGNQKKLLQVLREDLIQGNHVYISFSKFPQIFDKVTVNLIKAAEEAGSLDVTLKDLKANIKKETEFNDKVKSALTYPAVIFMVFIGVFLMILIVVIPKISTVFSRLKVPLPLPTRIMIFVSNVVTQYTIALVIGIVIIIGGLLFLYKTNKRLILSIFFRFPLISGLIKEIDLTRFTRSLHYLLTSGIPIITALELTQDVVMRKDIAKIIAQSKEMVTGGKRMSEGLRSGKGKIPTIMIKIIEAGEKSGTLDKSLEDISEYLDYQVTNTLRTLTSLLEPIMLVFVGIMIGGMMLAIIGPIYGLISQVGSK